MNDNHRKNTGTRIVSGEVRRAVREAEKIIEDSKVKASKIILKAEEAAESIRKRAQQKGLCEAYRTAALIIAAANDYRIRLETKLEHELLELVTKIARKIVCTELTEHPETIRKRVKVGLQELADTRQIEINVNPGDRKYLEATSYCISSDSMTLVSDELLQPGDCIIRTPIMKIDMSVDQVLEMLKEDLVRISEQKGLSNDC